MYDFYYETLLEDHTKFSAVEGIQSTIIEVLDSREVSMLGTWRFYGAEATAMVQTDRLATGWTATPILNS